MGNQKDRKVIILGGAPLVGIHCAEAVMMSVEHHKELTMLSGKPGNVLVIGDIHLDTGDSLTQLNEGISQLHKEIKSILRIPTVVLMDSVHHRPMPSPQLLAEKTNLRYENEYPETRRERRKKNRVKKRKLGKG